MILSSTTRPRSHRRSRSCPSARCRTRASLNPWRAANNGRLPVCRALLAVGANPSFRDEKGKKPIDVLCGARGADRASKQVIHALLSAADAGD